MDDLKTGASTEVELAALLETDPREWSIHKLQELVQTLNKMAERNDSADDLKSYLSLLCRIPIREQEAAELIIALVQCEMLMEKFAAGSSTSVELDEAFIKIYKVARVIGRMNYCRNHNLKFFNRIFLCAHIIAGMDFCPEMRTLTRSERYLAEALRPFDCQKPPELDHLEMFKQGSHLVLTSQPYCRTEDLEPELTAWAGRYGLAHRIDPLESWHLPGRTIVYEVTRKGETR